MIKEKKHPLLAGLIALWNIDQKILNEILWALDSTYRPGETIGYANHYLDFMTAMDINNPTVAWEEFCRDADNAIEHEINNNPFFPKIITMDYIKEIIDGEMEYHSDISAEFLYNKYSFFQDFKYDEIDEYIDKKLKKIL